MRAKRKFKNNHRKDRQEQKKKRTQLIVSIVLIFLMIISGAGIIGSNQASNPADSFTYNGYEFEVQQQEGQIYFTSEVNNQEIIFYSLPQDVLRFPVEGNLTESLQPDYLIITAKHDPQINPLYDLMRFDFNRYGGKLVAPGILEANETVTTPVITCENATTQIPVIAFIEGNQTRIDATSPCITISATAPELAYMRDRILFSILGIIDR